MCVFWVWHLSPPAMSLDGLQVESDKAVTQLGSMLFTRQVSGARYENFERAWPPSGLEMETCPRETRGCGGVFVCVCVDMCVRRGVSRCVTKVKKGLVRVLRNEWMSCMLPNKMASGSQQSARWIC